MNSRENYIKKMHQMIDDIDRRIDGMEIKLRRTKDNAKIKYEPKIRKLKEQKGIVEEKIKHLKTAGEGAWIELKAELENSAKDLQKSFQNAADNFKMNI